VVAVPVSGIFGGGQNKNYIYTNKHTHRMTQVTLLTVMGMELYEFTTLWIMMGIGIYLPYRLIHRGLTDSNTNHTTDK
jgi:hypothetical protein